MNRSVYTRENCIGCLNSLFVSEKTESMYIILLSDKDAVLGIHRIAVGDDKKVAADIAVIINIAIEYNAAKAVLAHNHLSRITPSVEDYAVTELLADVLHRLGIKLADHLIFCNKDRHMLSLSNVKSAVGG